MKTKAILIDPSDQTVTEIQIETQSIEEIYKIIGNGCKCFSCPIYLYNGDTFYVDDDAWSNNIIGGIMTKDWDYPILGRIIVTGCDTEDLNWTDVKSKVDDIAKEIIWQSKEKCLNHDYNLKITIQDILESII